MNAIPLIAVPVLALTVVSAACAKRTPVESAVAPSSIETVPPAPPPAEAVLPTPPERELTEDELFARKTVADLNAERPLGEVFFALDQATIGEQGRMTLQRNAEWLRRWASTHVTLEGHCDERGTSEYNLALGERRASAVRDYLVSLGIDGARLVGVSKGKEAPACVAQSEECWQQNRRAQSIITAK